MRVSSVMRDRLWRAKRVEGKKYSLRQNGTRFARAGLWHA
jgi:hypothetical protein